MTKHKHAELMVMYAKDAFETDEPWKRWECCRGDDVWNRLRVSPSWVAHHQYRRKPKTSREALSEIREIYTGSEGIPNPETAAEAYVLRLVEQMYQVAVKALQESSDE